MVVHPSQGWGLTSDVKGQLRTESGAERAELKHVARDVYDIFGVRVIVGLLRGFSVLETGS